MHVAMITNFPADLDHPQGGLEAVVSELTRALRRLGIELTILRYGAPDSSIISHGELGCQVIGLPYLRPATVTSWLVQPARVERILRDVGPDVVHVQAVAELYSSRRFPSVLSVHGIPWDVARHYYGGLLGLVIPRIFAFSFPRALPGYDEIIAISPYVLEALGLEGSASTHAIPNPVEDRFFGVTRAPEAGRVLFAGVLSPVKNVVGLVEAAALVCAGDTQAHLRVAGPWRDAAYRSEVEAAVARHGLGDRVEFLGALGREELVAELSRCACLVLPSLQETAPMAVQEAMAAGVPVAAAEVGGIPAMLAYGEAGGLFDPQQPQEIAAALSRLLEHCDEARHLGATARRLAETSMRSDEVAERTIEVYERALRRAS